MSLDYRIKEDLEERLEGKEITKSVALKPLATFSTKGMPGYFTGNKDAQTVFVQLNPGLDADIADKRWDFETKYFDKTSIQNFVNDYIESRRNYGKNDRMRYDPFDVKQAAFLYDWPESGINFSKPIDWTCKDKNDLAEKKETSWLEAKERVLLDKLQLELIPYASSKFDIKKGSHSLLSLFVETMLDEIFRVNPRQYVIFGGSDFDTLFKLYNKEKTPDTFKDLTKKQSIPLTNLKKKDGSNWTTPLNYTVIGINYKGMKQKALIAYTFPQQGLNNAFEIMRAYGQRCWEEYNKIKF